MSAGVEVPWPTCAEPGCDGVRLGAGPSCLVHLPPEALTAALSSTGPYVDLDARGVRFDRDSLKRVVDALPVDDAGRQLLGAVRFDRATFEHSLSLDGALFRGPVSMVGALCKGDARFGGAEFGGAVDCSEATFEGQAWFLGARFAQPASFRSATFGGPAWFQQATFAGDVSFDGARFSANATISSSRFDGAASFRGAAFERRARFDKSSSAGGWRFDDARFREEPEGLPAGAYKAAPVVAPPDSPPVEGRSPAQRSRPPHKRRRFTLLLQILAGLVVVAVIAFIVLRTDDAKPKGFKDYAFLLEDPKTGAPARWNPCEPIRYVVNDAEAPRGAVEELDQAIAAVSAATGIKFQSEGHTTEKLTLTGGVPTSAPVPSGASTTANSMDSTTRTTLLGAPEDPKVYAQRLQEIFHRPAYQPDRYGKDRWAPVLIGWSPFAELGENDRSGLLGIGASEPRDIGGGQSVYVTGLALFNPTAPQRFARATMMHELSHVMGLAHVASGDELMFGSERRQTDFGNGDREGLRRVGAESGCLPVPPAKA